MSKNEVRIYLPSKEIIPEYNIYIRPCCNPSQEKFIYLKNEEYKHVLALKEIIYKEIKNKNDIPVQIKKYVKEHKGLSGYIYIIPKEIIGKVVEKLYKYYDYTYDSNSKSIVCYINETYYIYMTELNLPISTVPQEVKT